MLIVKKKYKLKIIIINDNQNNYIIRLEYNINIK